MERPLENGEVGDKSAAFRGEYEKLTAAFTEVEPQKRKLVEGLIQDAAFIYAENWELRRLLNDTGMVRCHPARKELQKPVEAARQYRQNVNSYAVIIKTLNGVLSKNVIEESDGMEEFE